MATTREEVCNAAIATRLATVTGAITHRNWDAEITELTPSTPVVLQYDAEATATSIVLGALEYEMAPTVEGYVTSALADPTARAADLDARADALYRLVYLALFSDSTLGGAAFDCVIAKKTPSEGRAAFAGPVKCFEVTLVVQFRTSEAAPDQAAA